MALAIYKQQNEAPNTIPMGKSAHAGLWFEKFFQDYNPSFEDIINENRQIFTDLAKIQGNATNIDNKNKRLSLLVSSNNGISKIFTTNWHFITGMGQNHAIENGFTWHTTLATPFLSGASVKGLLRHWMKYYQPETYQNIAQLWFGNESTNHKEQYAGKLIFLDAVPTKPTTITADIMAPHYGDWYSKGEQGNVANAPHDAHKPVPISFLSVKQASFAFSIMPSNLQDEQQVQATKQAMEQLGNALKYLGAGAKTSAGYGRMFEDEEATKKTTQQAIEQNKSELIKKMDRLEKELKSVRHAVGSKPMIDSYDFLTKHKDNFKNWEKEEQARVVIFFENYHCHASKKKIKEANYKATKLAINELK